MQTGGERHVSNAGMQNLLEFLSYLPADEVIDKELRCKRKVIDFIVTVIHEKGIRGQNIVMPIDYSKHGPLHDEAHCLRPGRDQMQVEQTN